MRPMLVEEKVINIVLHKNKPMLVGWYSSWMGTMVFFVLVIIILKKTYDYVVDLPIENPDLSCLPENIRNNEFCRNIMRKARRSIKNQIKPIQLRASNEDELSINLSPFIAPQVDN
jgi:hypothetical protein